MDTEFFVGETIHISADALTMRTGEDVTTGATVTIDITDGEGTIQDTEVVTSPTASNDWGADLDAPLTPGSYIVKIQAVKIGKTWRAKRRITVNPF